MNNMNAEMNIPAMIERKYIERKAAAIRCENERKEKRDKAIMGAVAIFTGLLSVAISFGAWAAADLIPTPTQQTEDTQIVETISPTQEATHTEAQAPTAAPTPTATAQEAPGPFYALTAEQRDIVERVVMAEAGGESFKGQMLVAQCILNACNKDGIEPSEAVVRYQYTKRRPDASESVKKAVAAVFDDGQTVTDEPVLYFYAPAIVASAWHESQDFVIEVGGHRFFAESEE